MMLLDLVGYAAAICSTTAFMPQAVKVIKTQDTRSLSLSMYVILTLGVGLWLSYGIIKVDIPIIAANAVTLIFSLVILVIKFKHRKSDALAGQ